MPDRAFFDTNILVYAFSGGDRRQATALKLLLSGGTVGVQTLNEFVNVATQKLRTPWPEAVLWLQTIQQLCPSAIPVTMSVHHEALRIAQTCGYHIYDALMLAAAREASCTVFYSEDMQHGHTLDGLRIQNPFVQANS